MAHDDDMGDAVVQTVHEGLPFDLPPRAPVRRIRVGAPVPPRGAPRTQPMARFEDRFTDIVDYIVRITDEIWQDRAIGYIRDTYNPDCVIHSGYGTVRGAEPVVVSTLATINAGPDGDTNHLNVAWSGDEQSGFYTAHLGYGGTTNVAPTLYGPATGKRYTMRFAADCVSAANMIHTEWLVRDAGAMVRQMGFDLDEAARAVAAVAVAEPWVPQPRAAIVAPPRSIEAWATALFDGVWNARRFDRLAQFYSPDVVVYSGGGRVVQGLGLLSDLVIGVLAAIPDGIMSIEHVCWSEETDGVIVAVRWLLTGSTARGGVLGSALPESRAVTMMGSSHLRLAGPLIVEEWTVFDEVAVMAAAYRD